MHVAATANLQALHTFILNWSLKQLFNGNGASHPWPWLDKGTRATQGSVTLHAEAQEDAQMADAPYTLPSRLRSRRFHISP